MTQHSELSTQHSELSSSLLRIRIQNAADDELQILRVDILNLDIPVDEDGRCLLDLDSLTPLAAVFECDGWLAARESVFEGLYGVVLPLVLEERNRILRPRVRPFGVVLDSLLPQPGHLVAATQAEQQRPEEIHARLFGPLEFDSFLERTLGVDDHIHLLLRKPEPRMQDRFQLRHLDIVNVGAAGTFDTTIPLGNILSNTVIRIEVQDISAADGSLLAMDSVELVVK